MPGEQHGHSSELAPPGFAANGKFGIPRLTKQATPNWDFGGGSREVSPSGWSGKVSPTFLQTRSVSPGRDLLVPGTRSEPLLSASAAADSHASFAEKRARRKSVTFAASHMNETKQRQQERRHSGVARAGKPALKRPSSFGNMPRKPLRKPGRLPPAPQSPPSESDLMNDYLQKERQTRLRPHSKKQAPALVGGSVVRSNGHGSNDHTTTPLRAPGTKKLSAQDLEAQFASLESALRPGDSALPPTASGPAETPAPRVNQPILSRIQRAARARSPAGRDPNATDVSGATTTAPRADRTSRKARGTGSAVSPAIERIRSQLMSRARAPSPATRVRKKHRPSVAVSRSRRLAAKRKSPAPRKSFSFGTSRGDAASGRKIKNGRRTPPVEVRKRGSSSRGRRRSAVPKPALMSPQRSPEKQPKLSSPATASVRSRSAAGSARQAARRASRNKRNARAPSPGKIRKNKKTGHATAAPLAIHLDLASPSPSPPPPSSRRQSQPRNASFSAASPVASTGGTVTNPGTPRSRARSVAVPGMLQSKTEQEGETAANEPTRRASIASEASSRSSSDPQDSDEDRARDERIPDTSARAAQKVSRLISSMQHELKRPITPSDDKRTSSPSNYGRIRALWGKAVRGVVKKGQKRKDAGLNPGVAGENTTSSAAKKDPWTFLLHAMNVDPSLKREVGLMQAMVRRGGAEAKGRDETERVERDIRSLLEDRGRWLMSSQQQKVRVVVRVRPIPPEDDISSTPGSKRVAIETVTRSVDLTASKTKHTFEFDRVYSNKDTNERIYQQCARPLVASIFQKRKVSMFSYGATGSGKTYTMIGVGKDRGIFYRTVRDIYRILSLEEHRLMTADLSMFEVYGSGIHDLLNQRLRLKARNDKNGNTRIVGLTHQVCGSLEEMMAAADRATQFRKVGQTHANDVSSRSHAIIRIRVIELEANKVHGMFQIIDLAGSERARDIGAVSKERQREGAEINKSLLALKECIRAMGKNRGSRKKKRKTHVSFRSSVLTRLLKSSLCGNTNTIMVACVAPTKKSLEPTMNTLRYATQLKNLKAVVSQKSDAKHAASDDEELARPPKESEKLLAIVREQRALLDKEATIFAEHKRVVTDLERMCKELVNTTDSKTDVALVLQDLNKLMKKKSILLHGIPRLRGSVTAMHKKLAC